MNVYPHMEQKARELRLGTGDRVRVSEQSSGEAMGESVAQKQELLAFWR